MLSAYFKRAVTAPAQAWQERFGSRAARQYGKDELSACESSFIESRDAFYLVSASDIGRSCAQHYSGPNGFVRHIRGDEVGWATFAGHRHEILNGDGSGNDRVAMFFLDFAGDRQLTVLGRMTSFDERDRPDLALRLMVDGYRARIARLAVLEVGGFDWNCPPYIKPCCAATSSYEPPRGLPDVGRPGTGKRMTAVVPRIGAGS